MAVYLSDAYGPRGRSVVARPEGPVVLNQDSPQARGLGVWLPLGTGIAAAYGARLSSATGVGIVGTPPTIGGTATQFDASSDQLNWGTPSGDTSAGSSAFSLALWQRISTLDSPGTGRRWVSRWGPTLANAAYIFAQKDGVGGAIVVAIYGSALNVAESTSTSAVAVDGWHLWVWTFAAGTHQLYRDGVAIATTNGVYGSETTLNSSTTYGLCCGQDATGSNGLLGEQCHVLLYPRRVLTAADVWSLYDPRSRWDLYWRPSTRVYVSVSGGGGGGAVGPLIGGPLVGRGRLGGRLVA